MVIRIPPEIDNEAGEILLITPLSYRFNDVFKEFASSNDFQRFYASLRDWRGFDDAFEDLVRPLKLL